MQALRSTATHHIATATRCPLRCAAALALVLIILAAPAAYAFPPAAPMATARYDHTATGLSYRVLVVGGIGSGGANLTSAELYDPFRNTWSAAASLAVARSRHTATYLAPDKVLVVGGYGASAAPTHSVELYDRASNAWSVVAPLASARVDHTATPLGSGRVLVVGGSNASTVLASVEIYDSATNTWTAAAPLATARDHHTATLLQPSGKVLVTGGRDASHLPLASAELYDPATNTWSAVAAMNRGRYGHTASLPAFFTGMSAGVLVAGGVTSDGLGSAEIYDPVGNTWTITSPFGVERAYQTATALYVDTVEAVLVVGGVDPSSQTVLADATGFGPNAQTQLVWSPAGSLATARERHTGTDLPTGHQLLAGGFDGTHALASTELTPADGRTTTTSTATVIGPSNAVGVWVTFYDGPQTILVGDLGLCTASCTIGSGGTCGSAQPVLSGCAGGDPFSLAPGQVDFHTLILTQTTDTIFKDGFDGP